MNEKETMDIIEQGMLQGKSITQISLENEGFNIPKIYRTINNLNDLASTIYDPDRYKRVKALQEENKKVNVNTYDYTNLKSFKKAMIEKYAYGEISLLNLSSILHLSGLDLLLEMITLKSMECYPLIKEKLGQLGIYEEQTKNSLLNYPKSVQNEIALMALTYRLSLKGLSQMFKTTPIDIIKMYHLLDADASSYVSLILETAQESSINERLALQKAKKYWKQRNELIKALNATAKENTLEKQKIKDQIKELHEQIDDSKIYALAKRNKKILNEQERDFVALYVLKYYISVHECSKRLKMQQGLIREYIEDLKNRNMWYQEKMEMYNSYFTIVKNKCIEDHMVKH